MVWRMKVWLNGLKTVSKHMQRIPGNWVSSNSWQYNSIQYLRSSKKFMCRVSSHSSKAYTKKICRYKVDRGQFYPE